MLDSYLSSSGLENGTTLNGKLLTPFQRKILLKSLQINLQPEYHRRLKIMLLADIGKSQTQICQMVGCSQEMARYWTAIAEAGLAHKWHDQPIGRPKTVNEPYLERLKELVLHSPREYGYGFQIWTAQWLSKHLAKEFGIEISGRHINRLLKQMGLSTRFQRNNSQLEFDSTQDSGITIGDLQPTAEAGFHWSFDKLKITH
jgi:transposase